MQIALAQQQNSVPSYIIQGLNDYQDKGYEAAVHTWFRGSPFENGTAMLSKIMFFKNIEMLYGRYLGYDIIFVQQTATSSKVYVRMNYERTAGYIMFTSMPREDKWVLTDIDLDRLQ
nr:hypothetical protein [Desulfobacterales bacterium]